MDLTSLAQLAEIVGSVAVVAAIAFGIVQVRQFRQQRHDAAAVELMRSIQDIEFTRSFRIIYFLPDGLSAKELRAMGPDVEDAAIALVAKFETMGLLVFRENIPLEMVEELVGGVGIDLWRKLKPWAEDLRIERQQPLMFEWFQWLAELLERRGRSGQTPAQDRYRDWQPRHHR